MEEQKDSSGRSVDEVVVALGAQTTPTEDIDVAVGQLAKGGAVNTCADEDSSPKDYPTDRTGGVFKLIFILQLAINIDSGCLPASLVLIENELDVSVAEQGALGGLVYIGLTLGSILAAPILRRYNQRTVIVVAILVNALMCVLFGLAPYTIFLELSRFGTGMSQAFLVVFAPIWVDEFAPADRQTLWMSLLQLSIPLGVMLGYVFGVVSGEVGGDVVDGWGGWRVPFVVQGFLIIPLILSFCKFPLSDIAVSLHDSDDPEYQGLTAERARALMGSQSSDLTVRNSRGTTASSEGTRHAPSLDVPDGEEHDSLSSLPNKPAGVRASVMGTVRQSRIASLAVPVNNKQRSMSVFGGLATARPSMFLSDLSSTAALVSKDSVERRSTCAVAMTLLSNGVYIWTVLSLTALYFVVTGIQFWVTKYLVSSLGHDPGTVGVAFVVVSATAPTAGVVFGGWITDKRGGYQGLVQAYKTLSLNTVLVVIAVVCCSVAANISDLFPIMVFIFALLFCGGCVVPSCTGIIMDTVPSDLRTFASALSQIIFNTAGYALSPFLSGLVAQAADPTGKDVRAGFQLVLYWSLWGLVTISLALFCAYRRTRV